MRNALRLLIAGTLLGLVILGVGGRLAMAAIAIDSGQQSRWSLGGSMTVIFLGAVSGLAGGGIALASHFVTRRILHRAWIHYALFSLAMVLLTMRGLRGTGPAGHWYFYALVGLYGVALELFTRPTRSLSDDSSSRRREQLVNTPDEPTR